MTHKLFVYGTLKRETGLLHELVGRDRYRFVGMGNISGKKLKGTPYPAVIKDPSGEPISGEVFELLSFPDTIKMLDAYEAFNPDNPSQSLYTRELVTVTLNSGQTVEAWVYYYNEASPGNQAEDR